MRLLTPQEHDTKVKDEERSARRRLDEVSEALSTGLKSLNQIKDEDRQARARIIESHRKFVAEKEAERATLEKEVYVLEERKREALKPLDARERELDEFERSLNDRAEILDKKEENLAEKEDKLDKLKEDYEKKLGGLEEKSSEIAGRERKLRDDEVEFKRFMAYKESIIKEERQRLRELSESIQKSNKT